ncbi:hypothetical protein [Nocardia brasiliensis]|uniref:hypothetical protein n=1 Tax=Nocardia brasiliensis TaxID=37326 RepID=UPI00245564C1|nr:hypothetical protein [Nocardia brasiliensis]
MNVIARQHALGAGYTDRELNTVRWQRVRRGYWLSRLAHAAEIARGGRRTGDWYSETTDGSYGSQGV